MDDIRIGVIGGSGLYRLFGHHGQTDGQSHSQSDVHGDGQSNGREADGLDGQLAAEQRDIETPYGPARVTIGELAGKRVAFLTRHGVDHSVPPHLINYRANIWALASLGVKAIVSSSAVGGVTADYPPGTLALPDQYIDRTTGRADTFFDRGSVQHLASADPFDPVLRGIAASVIDDVKETGTIVVIQGPRFSTRAESRWFASAGANLVNMTLYPEVPLASELNLGTVNLSFVTDADAGLSDPDAEEVSGELVFRRLAEAQPRIVAAITAIVARIPDDFEPRTQLAPEAVAEVLAR